MVRVLGSRQRTCEGWTRREMLSSGTLSLLGISLSQTLALQEAQAAASARTVRAQPPHGKAKSVILVFLFGAPSHQDTFDMKPEAPSEIRGEFKPVGTNVDGIRICEHLPLTAQQAHRLAVIRSLHHSDDSHSSASLLAMSGHAPANRSRSLTAQPDDWPSMGSVCSSLLKGPPSLPGYVFMPHLLGKYQAQDLGGGYRPGPFAGFLGRAYDPFGTDAPPSKPSDPVDLTLPDFAPAPGLTLDRLSRRRSLLQQVDARLHAAERSSLMAAMTRIEQRAFQLTTSSEARRAFDLSAETPALRDRYGRNRYGNSLLTARRLVEAGVPFVTVSWDVILPAEFDYDAWDTHTRNFAILKERNLPVFDRGFSALLDDLAARGLLEETLVLVMGEYGRTPKINAGAGRDHWPFCYSALMAGAGVRGGTVYGKSDAQAAYPAEDPVSPQDIIATVYNRLGIDPYAPLISDLQGRPLPLLDSGRVIEEILTG